RTLPHVLANRRMLANPWRPVQEAIGAPLRSGAPKPSRSVPFVHLTGLTHRDASGEKPRVRAPLALVRRREPRQAPAELERRPDPAANQDRRANPAALCASANGVPLPATGCSNRCGARPTTSAFRSERAAAG